VSLPVEEWRRGWIRRPASETLGRHGSAVTGEGGPRPGGDSGMARSITRGREQGCGFGPDYWDEAAGRRFMARVRAWQCCDVRMS
jgi:hypothetical protein